jgi:hypothetical protein
VLKHVGSYFDPAGRNAFLDSMPLQQKLGAFSSK